MRGVGGAPSNFSWVFPPLPSGRHTGAARPPWLGGTTGTKIDRACVSARLNQTDLKLKDVKCLFRHDDPLPPAQFGMLERKLSWRRGWLAVRAFPLVLMGQPTVAWWGLEDGLGRKADSSARCYLGMLMALRSTWQVVSSGRSLIGCRRIIMTG